MRKIVNAPGSNGLGLHHVLITLALGSGTILNARGNFIFWDEKKLYKHLALGLGTMNAGGNAILVSLGALYTCL